jgi:ribose 5-phosphate isomerase B
MKIFLGADHRGFELKEFLKEKLKEENFDFEDCGNFIYDPNDDYSDIAFKVAYQVRDNPENLGILICGSGAGVCFSANKVKGIRAGLAITPEMARMMKADDDVNVLCLASDFTQNETAWQIAKAFLETKFKHQEKYLRRIQKVKDYENKNYPSN